MKLFNTVLGLLAAEVAHGASDIFPFIPFDCYEEGQLLHGNSSGTKISDKSLISGLDIQNSKLKSIASCIDNNTKLISGIVTTWGTWDSNSNAWTDVKRMNIIGKLSGLQSFDDQGVMTAADLGTLSSAAKTEFKQYWYQEASPT